MNRLNKSFYNRKPEFVAKELLGKLLVHKKGSQFFVGRIVETEAYLAKGDTACHATRGKTKRNAVMFGEAGLAYTYLIYGMYHCLNIVTEREGRPSAVLIRAVEPVLPDLSGLTLDEKRKEVAGPGRLARYLKIEKSLNEEDITKSERLYITDSFSIKEDCYMSKKVKPKEVSRAPRIGVDYSQDSDLLLRYYIKDNQFVSKK
ncbi:MAG: DNA-3-methyladenine glycosylase [Patescibacteria group bacterium]|nr:DNA-3-methyladenine glycosylase [Patescibacteria group bacterium]